MKMGSFVIYSFLCIFFAYTSTALAKCGEGSKSGYEKILTRAVKSGIPGVQYYYQKDSCIIHLAKGSANLSANTELRKQDRFVIGSITKMFVGVSSVKLAQAGVFSLDDNLPRWLPVEITSRIPDSHKITIRHLLSHTSGIFDYLNDSPAFVNDWVADLSRKRTELDALSYVAGNPLFFEPGTVFRYSNTNYLLMGLIIKAATHQHFTRVIHDQILEPLALRDTFHLAEPKETQLSYVHGYREIDGLLYDIHDVLPNIAFADGSMVSTARDLAKFIQSIFTDRNFMSTESLATLLSSPLGNNAYGLGIGIDNAGYEKNTEYGHTGAEAGYEASLRYIPATNETMVTQANGNGGALDLFDQTYILELIRERIQSQRSVGLAQGLPNPPKPPILIKK